MAMNSRQRRSLRALLARKYGERCCYCGSARNLTIEHRVPKSHGGTNRVHNLRLSCHPCNHRKGVMSEKEFMAWVAKHPGWVRERLAGLWRELIEDLDTGSENDSSRT